MLQLHYKLGYYK